MMKPAEPRAVLGLGGWQRAGPRSLTSPPTRTLCADQAEVWLTANPAGGSRLFSADGLRILSTSLAEL